MDWVKKNKDWLIALSIVLGFVIALTLAGLFFRGQKPEKRPLPTIEEEVKFDVPKDSGGGDTQKDTSESPQTSSFFLRPSPTELLQKLENLDYHEFKNETKNLPGLRIMWPAYFFSIMKIESDKAQVMLDSTEDGFGVIMVTEINLLEYPEIQELERGTKIWLAAEITGIDPTGTGQFFLKTEYVRFDDYQPPTPPPPPTEKPE